MHSLESTLKTPMVAFQRITSSCQLQWRSWSGCGIPGYMYVSTYSAGVVTGARTIRCSMVVTRGSPKVSGYLQHSMRERRRNKFCHCNVMRILCSSRCPHFHSIFSFPRPRCLFKCFNYLKRHTPRTPVRGPGTAVRGFQGFSPLSLS